MSTIAPPGANRFNPETGDAWFSSRDKADQYAYMCGLSVRKSGHNEWVVTNRAEPVILSPRVRTRRVNVYNRHNSDYVNATVSIFELWNDGNPVNRTWRIVSVKDESEMETRLTKSKQGYSLLRADKLEVAIDWCEGEAMRMGGRIEGRIEQYLAENQHFWRAVSSWPAQVKSGPPVRKTRIIRRNMVGYCRECGKLTRSRFRGSDGRDGFYCSGSCAAALTLQHVQQAIDKANNP